MTPDYSPHSSASSQLEQHLARRSVNSAKSRSHSWVTRSTTQASKQTKAIREMEPPTTVSELHRFLGIVNQLGKFAPQLAHLTQPLRGLLSKGATWLWGPDQSQSFSQVKEELSKPTTLALYDVNTPTKLLADASSYGLGAVLLQEADKQWRPIAYASCSMSETEQRYAQIEKEALAITWACEKFSDYILGKPIQIETDHKPLVPLLQTNSWTFSHLVSSDSDSEWIASCIASTTSLGRISTRPTPYPEHPCPPPQAVRIKRNWPNSSWLHTYPTSLPVKSDWKCTAKLSTPTSLAPP